MEHKEMESIPEDCEEECTKLLDLNGMEPKRELVDYNKVVSECFTPTVTFDDVMEAIREHKSTVDLKQVQLNEQFAKEWRAFGLQNREPTEARTLYHAEPSYFDLIMDCLCISW